MMLLACDRQFPILCVLVQVDRWAGELREPWFDLVGSSGFTASDYFYHCCNRGVVTEGHRVVCLGRV